MKLSDFEADFDDTKLKRIALDIQAALLEHPCGEKLNIELDYVQASDVFQNSNIKIRSEFRDRKVFILRVHNEYDSRLEEPYGSEGLKVIVWSKEFCYLPMTTGADSQHRMRSFSSEKIDELVINLMFFIIPSGEEPIKSIKTAIASRHNKAFVDLHSHEPQYFFWEKGLKLDELAAEQTLMVGISTERETFSEFLRIKRIEIDGQESPDLKSAYSKHRVNSLLELMKKTRIKFIVTDISGEREFSSMLYLKKHGVAAALYYNDERCHADLLVKA